MIKYLGSKRKLIPRIVEIIKEEGAKKVIDLFAGTSRVGHALQNEGITVLANDHNEYAHFLATTHVQANPEEYKNLQETIDYLNQIKPKAGWFTKTYCEDARFFHPKNGAKIEAIRNYIEKEYGQNQENYVPEIYRILIVSLMEAADRVDSTCGQQMAYLKSWAKRAHNDLELRVPKMSKGKGIAVRMDALEVAKVPMELAYIDPPYNQHNYLGNYHIWETLSLWDEPETYGKAQKRIDVKDKDRKSDFNSKKRILSAFQELIDNLASPKALVSFSDEGYMTKEDLISVLKTKFSSVEVIEIPYQRYVGAKIGIYDNKGKKVGKVSHTENKEYLFLAKD
jgi:adenine-specific DNA-methyltransferase